MVYQVMLVQAPSNEEAPPFVLPFVLQIGASYAHFLFHISFVTYHFIFQAIVVVFGTEGEVRRHEE